MSEYIEPGRKLDALIAEKIMGWKKLENFDQLGGLTWNGKPFTIEQFKNLYSMDIAWLVDGKLSLHECPEYSTDIAAAWLVIEKVTEEFSPHELVFQQDKSSSVIKWWVTFSGDRMSPLGPPRWTLSRYSLPHAICLAALKVSN